MAADTPANQPDPHRKRLHFDGTINAGHVLQLVGMLILGFGAWASMDKRVTVLEVAKTHQEKRDDTQDRAIEEKLGDIKEAVREVKRGVEQIKEHQLQQRLNAGR